MLIQNWGPPGQGAKLPHIETEMNFANKHIGRLPISEKRLLRGLRVELFLAPPLGLPPKLSPPSPATLTYVAQEALEGELDLLVFLPGIPV